MSVITPGYRSALAVETQRPIPVRPEGEADIGRRLEQLLWTEMLSHTGLEEAMSTGGAEGASEFFRFMIESLARDFAEQHPLGLNDRILPPLQEGMNEP